MKNLAEIINFEKHPIHNQEYINKLQFLGSQQGVGTKVSIGGQKYALPRRFYVTAAADLNNINQLLSNEYTDTNIDAFASVNYVNNAVKRMKKRFTFIPFIANTKKASKLKNGVGVDDVTILAKKTYTKENPFPNGSKKPAFQTISPSYKNRSFKEIAYNMTRTTSGGGKNKRKQKGGADLGAVPSGMFVNGQSVAMLYYMFPGDDDEPVGYQYTKPDEIDSPVFNIPNEFSPSFQFVNQGNIYNHFHINLMEQLNQSFIASINNIIQRRGWGRNLLMEQIEFIELIYTELIYTSYINNEAPINITDNDIYQLMNQNIMDVPPKKRAITQGTGSQKFNKIFKIKRGNPNAKRRGFTRGPGSRRHRQAQRGRSGGGGKKTRRRRKKHKRKTRKKR